MAEFFVTGPDGKKYRVTGETAEGAVAAVKKMAGGQPAEQPRGFGSETAAALRGFRHGFTAGFDDEIMGAVGATFSNPLIEQQEAARQRRIHEMGPGMASAAGIGLPQSGPPLGDEYQRRRGDVNARLAEAREVHPANTGLGEVAGVLANPIGNVMRAGKPVVQAAVNSGLFSGLYAMGEGEGNIAERAAGAADDAAFGALFGAAANKALNLGGKAAKRLAGKAARRPTIQGLEAAKNAAYRAVDEAGETFSQNEMRGLVDTVTRALDDLDYVPETDVQTKAALAILGRRAEAGPQTIGQVDKVRQGLWDRFNKTKEPGVRAAIEAIDDLIANRSSTNELMTTARAAHARFKKAELIEAAVKRAQDQTSSAGSGGNILNKYRQAATRIINDPKQAKWFNAEEQALLQRVIDGDVGENTMRRIGKASPSGNGLMLMLNLLGASTVGPEFLAATAVGVGAKELADRSGERSMNALRDAVAGAPPPAPALVSPGALNRLSGFAGAR